MGNSNSASSRVPTGIQQLLLMARKDARLRALLLEKRAETAIAAGVQLNASEQGILAAVSSHQLETMIDRVPRSASNQQGFLPQTTASALVVLGGDEGCSDSSEERGNLCGGSRPDVPSEDDDADTDAEPDDGDTDAEPGDADGGS